MLGRTTILAGLLFAIAALFAGPAGAAGEQIVGTINNQVSANEKQPVEGVEISVAQCSESVLTDTDPLKAKCTSPTDVGSASTDALGKYAIDLPGEGVYRVSLDEASLPRGVEVTEGFGSERVVKVNPSQKKAILFPLGKSTRETRTKWAQAAQLTVDGLKFGMIIAMCAVGLSLIFSTTGLTNFAHGEMVSAGMLLTYLFNQIVGLSVVVAAVISFLLGGLIGAGLEAGIWKPLRRRKTGLTSAMIVSIGLGILFKSVFQFAFGTRTRPYNQYSVQKAWTFGPISITPKDVALIVIALVVLVSVALSLQLTKTGKAIRAVSDNPDLASASGINSDRIILFVWIAGGALAALGGTLQGINEQVSFQGGSALLLLMFAGITLGGLTNPYGALVGCFVVGLVVQVSTLWIASELKTVGALGVLIVVLLVRPQGILGRAERVG